MKTALITTTIHIPKNLEGYFANLQSNGNTDVITIVIGDNKSPAETGAYLAELSQKTGFEIDYWDVDRQRAWLKDLPELDALLPYNSVQRRNLAYLFAVEKGAENIITIDDDNFATDDDYLDGHGIIGQTVKLPVVTNSTGWFNTASLLVTDPVRPLFHRGFPICKRGIDETLTYGEQEGRVICNAGLWLGAPDACAMTHNDAPCDVTGFVPGFEGRLAVAHGTNMVLNSQNTAFHRDTLPAMFLMPMGGKCGHLEVGRYDDIWMGIFLKVIADHLGDLICAGKPLVKQIRNDHDLINDMLVEVPAQRITNTMTKTLPRVSLTGDDYGSCYVELIAQLRAGLSVDGYTAHEQEYMNGLYDGMETWAKISQGFLSSVD